MKEIISDYHQPFKYKLQDFSNQLSDYCEKFIAESKRLIDLSFQKLPHVSELYDWVTKSTAVGGRQWHEPLHKDCSRRIYYHLLIFLKQFSFILLLQLSFHVVGGKIKLYVWIHIIIHWASPVAGSWLQAEAHVNWTCTEAGPSDLWGSLNSEKQHIFAS